MEAEATYTAARARRTSPAWRASAARPGFPAGAEGCITMSHHATQFTRGKVKAPGRRHPPRLRAGAFLVLNRLA